MKNNIYMDRLPKDCFNCPFFKDDIYKCCKLDKGTNDYQKFNEKEDKCPLKHTSQINTKMAGKIRSLRKVSKERLHTIMELNKTISKMQEPRKMTDKELKSIKHIELLKICQLQKQELERLKSSFGKFKSVESLLKSYKELEGKFTKVNQELKKLKGGNVCNRY